MIEGMINSALKKAVSDPKRSIRNAIELVANNSHGRFQRKFFEAAQRMLTNQSSAYYTLGKRAVTGIEHGILKKFGINLGYNGCTCGAERIRRNKNELGFNIPWAIYIDAEDDNGSFAERAAEIISQGTELGVYVYVVFGGAGVSEAFRNIYRRFDECAFITACASEYVTETLMKRFDDIFNVAFSINADSTEAITEASGILNTGRRLYGIHRYYDNDSAENIFCDEMLKFYETTGAVFVCAIPSGDCTPETLQCMRDKVYDIRFGQKYAYFALDFAADMDEIDHIISDDTCRVTFCSDGTVHSTTGDYSDSEFAPAQNTLNEILRRVTPPKSK